MADADPSPVPRVAVAFHRLGPYHHARLRAAAARPIDLHAVAFSRSGGEYAWHDVPDAGGGGACARVTTLFEHAASEGADRAGMRRRVGRALDALAPDAVAIPGWSQPLALMILRHCLRRGWPVILMSESTRGDADRRRWREAVKRRVVALCGAALVGGAPHRAYARDLGFPDGAIEEGYDAIDDAYFARTADAVRARADELRGRHGLPERFFLASSRFVAKKNLPRLIEAYALYRRRAATSGSKAWKLVLLGDGPLGGRIRSEIRRHGLDADVILPGFRQYDELPAYYGLAGAFVHASTVEQWGLVVNEAMASGLPVVVSERCGCAPDLVREGVNGFAFDPDDADRLAGLLTRVAALDPGERGRMGAAGRAIVRAWGPERFAEGLLRTVRVALASPRPAPGAVDRALLHALATWPRQP